MIKLAVAVVYADLVEILERTAPGGAREIYVKLQFEGGEKDTLPITVNLPQSLSLAEGEFFVRDWGESQMLVSDLLRKGVIETTGRDVQAGDHTARIARLTPFGREYLEKVPGAKHERPAPKPESNPAAHDGE